MTAIRVLVGDAGDDAERFFRVPPTSPEEAAHAWRRMQGAQQALDRAREALLTFARAQPFSLGDGRMVGERLSRRETIEAQAARAVLGELYGSQGEALYVEASRVTKEGLRRALKGREALRETLEALRARRALRVSESVICGEHQEFGVEGAS